MYCPLSTTADSSTSRSPSKIFALIIAVVPFCSLCIYLLHGTQIFPFLPRFGFDEAADLLQSSSENHAVILTQEHDYSSTVAFEILKIFMYLGTTEWCQGYANDASVFGVRRSEDVSQMEQ